LPEGEYNSSVQSKAHRAGSENSDAALTDVTYTGGNVAGSNENTTLFPRLADLLSSGRQLIYAIRDRTTPIPIGELYDDVERDYVVERRKSLRDIRIRWRLHLARVFASVPAADLTTAQISTYIARRLEEKATPATVNRELAVLKRSYMLAIRNGRLKFAARPFIPMIRELNVRKGFVRDEQYAALARAAAAIGPWLRAMFELAFTYGWRVGELRALRVSNIDMVERTIGIEPGSTKNGDGRLVFMTQTVYQLLGPLIAGKSPDDNVFTRPTRGKTCSVCSHAQLTEIELALSSGATQQSVAEQFHIGQTAISRHNLSHARKAKTLLSVNNFRKSWKLVTEAAGCPGLLFHDLRRSGVRNLVRAGVDPKVAMLITGHKTASVFQRYQIIDETDLKEATRMLDLAAALRGRPADPQPAELPLEDIDRWNRPTSFVSSPVIAPRKPAGSDRPPKDSGGMKKTIAGGL